jgi:hypothetical protein
MAGGIKSGVIQETTIGATLLATPSRARFPRHDLRLFRIDYERPH